MDCIPCERSRVAGKPTREAPQITCGQIGYDKLAWAREARNRLQLAGWSCARVQTSASSSTPEYQLNLRRRTIGN